MNVFSTVARPTGPTSSTEHISESRGLPRRTVVKGAAWALPVIAAATSMPLAAASTVSCPSMGFYWGGAEDGYFQNLNGKRWQTGVSTGTVTIGLGNYTSGGYPAFSLSAPEPVQIDVLALSYTYTLPYPVNWTTIPSGWQLTSSSSAGGEWTYTFTYSNVPTTTIVTSDVAPGTTIVPTAMVEGTIIGDSIPNGTDMSRLDYTAEIDITYTPHFLNSEGCTSVNGSDGESRVRHYEVTRPLNLHT